jgi:YVTN family beta-propeller protein
MATLLTYTVNSGNAVPTPGTADFYFNISVENNGYSPVTLQCFQIAIPIGDGENDLTPIDDTAAIEYQASNGWAASGVKSAAGDYYNVTFYYTVKGGFLLSPGANPIPFTVGNITVNSCAGTADCQLTEYTESPTATNQGEFSFTKPYTPLSISFTASSYVVQAGDEVTVYWSGPAGWTYTITCGDEQLSQTTVNQGSHSAKLLTPTIFTLQLTQTGQISPSPVQFTVKVTPCILFTGVGQTNGGSNQLVLAWSTQYASKLTGSWIAGSLELNSADLPAPPIAPNNGWTSAQYMLTATSDDPTDALQYTKACAVAPPVVNSFAPGPVQQDENGYYMILTWEVSGAFYVESSWAGTTQFNANDQSAPIYAPFAPEYTITAYVLSDVSTTQSIQTASYFSTPVIEQFTSAVSANTQVLSWNVQPGNSNSAVLSVYGSWQSSSSASLPTKGSHTLNDPFVSSYTLTAHGLVSGQSTQQEMNNLWWVAEAISLENLPSLACISPIDNTYIVEFSWLKDNNKNITFGIGATIISNGRITNNIYINSGLDPCSRILVTPDGKTLLFVMQNCLDQLWSVSAYDINTAQPVKNYELGLASIVAVTPDNAYLYAAHTTLTTRVNLASGETNVIKMPDYTGANVTCMSITPNGETVFIGVSADFSRTGYVIPLTVQSNTLLPAIVLPNTNPCAIAFTPDNQYALVVSDNDNTILLIELSSLSVINTLMVYANPQSIAITPDGRYAFVANAGSDTVSVIDVNVFTLIQAMPVIQAIPVSSGLKSIAIAPDSSCVVVSNSATVSNISTVAIIDVKTLSVVQTLHAYSFNSSSIPSPAFSPDGSSLYLLSTDGGNGSFSVIVLKTQAA